MGFRLEALLRVRKNQEEKELKHFGEINTLLLQQKKSLDFMENLEKRNSQGLDIQRERGPDPNLLWIYDNFFNAVRIQEQKLESVVSEVTQSLQARLKTLTEAIRKRKTLEILKDREEEANRKKMLKQEQGELDEVASNLWGRRFF